MRDTIAHPRDHFLASHENSLDSRQRDSVPSPRCHAAFMMVLIAVSLVPIWATKRFPSQNGPWFLLPTHMFKEYHNPQWNFSEYYVRNWHPIPHMLHDSLVGLVSYLSPLLVAEKVVLTAYVLLLPASVFYFLSVVAPDKKFLGYLSFLMIHSYPFLRGYHDFSLSIPLFFLTLTYWMRCREHVGKLQALVLAGLSVLVYLSHLLSFALLAFVVGWIRLFETRSAAKGGRAVLVVTWPGWVLFIDFALLSLRATWLDIGDTSWLPFNWTVENFLRQFFYTVSFPAYVIAVVPWLWLGIFLLGAAAARRRRVPECLQQLIRHPMAALVIFLVLAYLVLPYKFLGWHKLNIRLVPFVLVLGVGCIAQIPRVAEKKSVRLAFIFTVLVAVVAVSGFVTQQTIAMNRLLAQYVSGVSAFEPNKRLLAIHLENPAFGQIRPLTRAHEYYHIEKGGANGGSLPALNTLSVMWYRTYPVEETFPEYDAAAPEQSMQHISQVYDYVLVWGTDQELSDRLQRFGFDPVHETENLHLYRKQEAGLRISSTSPANRPQIDSDAQALQTL